MSCERILQNEQQDSAKIYHYPTIASVYQFLEVNNTATVRQSPILALPRTSPSRLSSSHETSSAFPEKGADQTVLYLAYGSNLSATTFLGMRGIKPLSSVNVLVPSLALTFDLPGVPYGEPCFANTKYRDRSQTAFPSEVSCEKDTFQLSSSKPLNWTKPMIGVVYEVTPEDYAHIIATEGGGAAYQDILVLCHAFPDSYESTSPVPSFPKTIGFAAHTLFAPYQAPKRPDPSHLPWSKPLFRPSPSYAQPSLRYLSLIRTGAREHDLPTEYIAYLDSLHSYTITTTGQKVGGALFLGFWGPILSAIIVKGPNKGNDEQRSPWVISFMRFIFWTIWISYDWGFKAVAGDGERTIRDWA